MTAAFAPINQTVFTGFQQGDERAFEQIFRDAFPALAASAMADAGDEVCAARAVEGAFLDAWAQRDQFEAPEALEACLRKAVHNRALRERGRRAALHRFEAHEGVSHAPRSTAGTPLTADAIWAHLNTVLHTPKPDQESTARVRADVSRHEAAAHVGAIAKREKGVPALLMALVAALVVGGIAVLVWFLNPSGGDAGVDSALASPEARVRATGPGQRAVVELLDQSRVALGPDSRLRIPPGFGERLRAVGLEGAASFTVPAGGERPFLLRAGSATIRVTGTAFDVAAFPADDVVTVRVREGQVEVTALEKTRTLQAGGVLAVDEDGQMSEPGSVDVEQALGWADDQFVVVDRPLREVVPLLNRWYGLDLNVADAALLDRKATVRAPLSSSRKAIEAVEATAEVKFGYQGENKVLSDAKQAEKTQPARRGR